MSTPLNVVLIGSAGSGKSSLTIRFIANRFVGDSYRIQVDIDEQPEVLDIFDTAGTDDYAMVRDTYIREGEAFVCVYSITNEKSFEQVQNLYEHVLRVKDNVQRGQLAFVVCGTKSDLESERKVSTEQGKELAKTLGVEFFETSSVTGKNVKEAFYSVARQIRKQRGTDKPKKKRTCMIL